MSANGSQDEDRQPTERVILKREYVIVVPEGLDLGVLFAPDTASLRKLGVKAEKVEAWVEVDRNTALTKRQAITAYAGEPGTPDAKQGTYRAPTVRAWKDGMRFDAPPKPLVEASVIE